MQRTARCEEDHTPRQKQPVEKARHAKTDCWLVAREHAGDKSLRVDCRWHDGLRVDLVLDRRKGWARLADERFTEPANLRMHKGVLRNRQEASACTGSRRSTEQVFPHLAGNLAKREHLLRVGLVARGAPRIDQRDHRLSLLTSMAVPQGADNAIKVLRARGQTGETFAN